jgi:predicted nucleic acid-binding Zn ribbon protein
LISKTSFILKGTGWYATDYASPVRKKAKEAKDKSGNKAETKTETKAALKEEAAVKK